MSQLTYGQSWLDGSWPYRRSIGIPNTTGSELSEFQVKITLVSGISFDFSKASPDGTDIRLTLDDGITMIPYWIESWLPTDSASIWVKIPSIPLTGTTIYLYYGNMEAVNSSDGALTFEFFDDFEGWNEITPTTGWQELAPVPIASADVTVAVTGGKFYSFGGYGIAHVVQNSVNEYDPQTNTWDPKTPMPTSRWGMVAVEFNGLIYVFGGQGISAPTGVTEVYDPVTDSWSTRSNLPAAISYQGLMGVRYGERIHLFYKSYHYEYDPVGDVYVQRNNVPYPRTWSTCAVVGTNIYIIGGHDGSGGTNTNQVLDPATDTWSHETPLPVTIYGSTRENPVIDGKIYVTHGWDDDYFFVTNYMYDPQTGVWTQRGSATYPRDGVGCGVINNKLYVIGGRNVPSNTFGLTFHEVYDPASDTWYSQPGFTQWSTSGTTYVYTDESAKYAGEFGLVIEQPMDGSPQAIRYAETIEGFGSVYAVDFNWNVTDIGGIAELPANPQGMVRLTDATTSHGSIYFYEFNNTPSVRWYTGTWTDLQTSTWNSWHNVTIVRNGTNSQVVFDGNLDSPLSIVTGGSGTVRFGAIRSTQYIDNVRVRKWVANEPLPTVGTESGLNTRWTGAVSSAWSNPGNWTAGVPSDWTITEIQPSANIPLLNSSFSVSVGGRLSIVPGAGLTINGNLINAGQLTISSTLASSGSLIVTGTSTGNITYNRQLKSGAVTGSDYHLVAPPVASNSEINTGKISTVYQWSELTGAWTTLGITSALPGRAYNIRQEDASGGAIAFTGPIVSSDITVGASSPYNDNIGPGDSYFNRTFAAGRSLANLGGMGWNLLGNPYPSAISVDNFIAANYNATPSLSQFDPNYVALYLFDGTTRRYYYLSSSTGWPSGLELNETHVQAGQGFFVLAMNDNSEFRFTRAMQEHSTATPMLKSAAADTRWPGLQLKVKFSTGEGFTTVVYGDDMTRGLDPGYDIGLFSSGQAVEIYSTLVQKDNGVNFARQALPVSGADTITVPLGIDSEKGGEVTFSAITVPLGNKKFWLEDRLTGTFTDLGAGSYTVTLPAKTYGTGRFFLKSAGSIMGIETPGEDLNQPAIRIWASQDKVIIKGVVTESATAEVYDFSGTKILETRLSDDALNTVTLPSGSHGVYLVRVADGGKIYTQKVVLR